MALLDAERKNSGFDKLSNDLRLNDSPTLLQGINYIIFTNLVVIYTGVLPLMEGLFHVSCVLLFGNMVGARIPLGHDKGRV